jgi:hypothetical protein
MDEVHVLRPISLTSGMLALFVVFIIYAVLGVDLREPSSTAAASASVSAVQQVGYEDRYSASSGEGFRSLFSV